MPKPTNETLGENFRVDLLETARDKTAQVISRASSLIRTGMTENDAKKFSRNTKGNGRAQIMACSSNSIWGKYVDAVWPKRKRKHNSCENDIFFTNIGPIFDDHEGDVGRPFTVGNDIEMQKCCADAENIWNEVRSHWSEESVTGDGLYRFAANCPESSGWIPYRLASQDPL